MDVVSLAEEALRGAPHCRHPLDAVAAVVDGSVVAGVTDVDDLAALDGVDVDLGAALSATLAASVFDLTGKGLVLSLMTKPSMT